MACYEYTVLLYVPGANKGQAERSKVDWLYILQQQYCCTLKVYYLEFTLYNTTFPTPAVQAITEAPDE